MIDFWEAIGRLVTYPKLADEFIGSLPEAHKIARKDVKGLTGLDIPDADYAKVQTFFKPVLTEGILSIMAAGELFWTFSFNEPREKIKDITSFVKKAKIGLHGPSTGYFIGLGMLIIDSYVRKQIADSQPVFEFGPLLSAAERDGLMRLSQTPGFDETCLAFCRFPWAGGACNATVMLWTGHLHPLAVSEAYEGGKATGKGAGSW